MREGIPTEYKHYRFRSRLEATWARFFDLCEWPWKYEPFDYDGYIPDFVLLLPAGNVLVEVKPCLSLIEMKPHTEKIDKSPWVGEALIVGVGLMSGNADGWHRYIGLHGHLDVSLDRCWEPAILHFCAFLFSDRDGHTGFHSPHAGWWCRYGGKDLCNSREYIEVEEEFDRKWATAQNLVQWAPRAFGAKE